MPSDFTKSLKDYIPKDALQRNEFLKKYPNFDGRGLLIAIIDSGVDVSLDGLQKTSEGKPKIIDCFDFTESGNVDTSTVKNKDSKNCLIGLSGRLLRIPAKWSNPSGKWHLGIKSLHEYFSSTALKNLTTKRKSAASKKNELLKQKMEGKNLDKIVLEEYLKSTEDLSEISMVADCIVWFDGQKWLACIDTSFKGYLKDSKVLTNFRDEHEYSTFTKDFAYCITVHNEGNLLEIFTTSYDHGSFVAQIAAAHFPGQPERDGLAPGAQIISMSVLDPRFDFFANESALIQALKKCIEMKVHIVNYSINGFTTKTRKIVKEMVEKHGIIITKSGGNAGPVYFSTNSYDTPIYDLVFLIGSIITPDMKNNIYSIEKDENNNNEIAITKLYPHSSRGPNLNGSHTVNFVAPGSAIAEVSRFNTEKCSYFQGTSFAAPNAAGAIACLLTALKENSIEYSPFMIKFVLSKTAMLPENENKLEFGHGIIQIDAALDYCKSFSINNLDTVKLYKTEIEDAYINGWKKNCFLLKIRNGIMQKYLKLAHFYVEDFHSRKTYIKFLNSNYKELKGIIYKKFGEKNEIKKYRITVSDTVAESKLQLVPSTSNSFIKYFKIKNGVLTFKINPAKLQPGSLNHAELQAFDPLQNRLIFTLPITVILPLNIKETDNYSIQKELIFESAIPHRFFIHPPSAGYYCCITLTAMDPIIPETTISIHYAIEDCDIRYSKSQTKYLSFQPSSASKSQSHTIKIHQNYMYEICIIQNEAFKNPAKFKVKIDFLGFSIIKKNPQNFTIINSLKDFNGCMFLEFHSISYKLFANSFKFEKLKIAGVSKLYMTLIYNFKISKPTKCEFYICNSLKFFRAQVFTATNKFLHEFFPTDILRWVTLPTGSYYVAIFFEKDLKSTTLPFLGLSPPVTVMMEFENPVTANLFSTIEKREETKLLKDKPFSLIKNGEYLIHFDFKLPSDLANPLSSNSIVYGSLHFSYGESENEISEFKIPLSHEHLFVPKIKYSKKIKNKFDDTFQSFLPYSTEMNKLLASIMLPKMALKYEKQIFSKFYFTKNHTKLIKIIEMYLKNAINYTLFLQNCDSVKNTVYNYEKEIIERQKNAIIDILFIKADAMLDECLRKDCCSNIPSIFKERFGFDCIKEKLCLKKSWRQIIQEKALNFVKMFNITNKKCAKIQNRVTVANEWKADIGNIDEVATMANEEFFMPCKTFIDKSDDIDLESNLPTRNTATVSIFKNHEYNNNIPSNKSALNTVDYGDVEIAVMANEGNSDVNFGRNTKTAADTSNALECCQCNIPSVKPSLDTVESNIQLSKIISPQKTAVTEFQKEIEGAVSEFLEYVKDDENDIRKDLIQAKKAIVFGKFETALLHLNKLSTKCHTIPEFKFIDVAIIELLRQLDWNHLFEAHYNALLDRYRDY